ncbi:MAG: peptide-methionine (S)-S-oxide reductase MsrA, partial [Planctomycetota bacterium]
GCNANGPETTPADAAPAAAEAGAEAATETPAATEAPAIPAPEPPSGTKGERTETATFAGGCFWGMEELLRKVPGVLDTQVGYTGGHVENATYRDVKTGTSGHAEAVRLTFDPAVVSYEQLLAFLFRIHDPTSKNRQGNDVGTQYRSAIFYHSATQQASAEEAIARETAGDRWTKPITTQVVPAGAWYDAEDFHQDYLVKNPRGYTCHWIRD